MSLAVEVYDGSDPTGLPIHTFTEDDGRSLRVAINDVGTWSTTVPRGGTDIGEVQQNRWLKFRHDGDVVQAGRIGAWDYNAIANGEEAEEDLTVSGPGLLATLRDAIVYPHESTGRLARDTRFFNFASPEFDYSAWPQAIVQYVQGDPAESLPGIDVPEDWPTPTAAWIWGTKYNLGQSPPNAVGDCYFRTQVSVTAEGDFAFFITADDGYELWVDGVQLAAQTEAFIFESTHRIDQFLDAGIHEIGLKGTNIDRPTSPATNVAGVLFAMYSTTKGGELALLQVNTDDTWQCLAYPAKPPGFTPGAILDYLMTEAQDRGALQAWTWDFTHAQDSNGAAWAETIDISFRYTDTILDVLDKLAEAHIDFTADPDAIVLEAANKGGLGSNTGIDLQEGVHLAMLGLTNDPSRVTDLLTRDSEGILYEISSGVADEPPSGDSPRIESFLDAGSAASEDAAEVLAAGVFDTVGAYRVEVRATVVDLPGGTPFTDYQIGDTVNVPNKAGALTPTQVTAITASDVGVANDGSLEGAVSYVVEGYQAGAA